MEQEYAQPEETTQKKYIRNFTEEGREKQKIHLETIRKKAMEKKRELKEITLKAKLMKLLRAWICRIMEPFIIRILYRRPCSRKKSLWKKLFGLRLSSLMLIIKEL